MRKLNSANSGSALPVFPLFSDICKVCGSTSWLETAWVEKAKSQSSSEAFRLSAERAKTKLLKSDVRRWCQATWRGERGRVGELLLLPRRFVQGSRKQFCRAGSISWSCCVNVVRRKAITL